jgi:UDP-N-acetylmuramyl pentapeptide phosphotransferase/UDP-N-acetylglucosamine-1-phosphate transferase
MLDEKIIYSLATSLLISILFTPFLIQWSRRKGLIAKPNHRTSHDDHVPNSGGIVLCFAVLIPLMFFSGYPRSDNFNLLLSAFAVLLITGIIDDFNPIPVFYKFLGQFIPAMVIVSLFTPSDLLIPFVSGWIHVPGIINYLFWIVVIVVIMNAYNLIDGLDGLAIGLGIFAGLVFGILFLSQDIDLAIFAFSLSGGLAGILGYNLSRRYKIFIGDTGSLLIGGILGFFTLKYINVNGPSYLNQATYHVLGILFLPLFDLIRVIISRVMKRQSPFIADRNHIHHIILDKFSLNHMKTSGILVMVQVVIFFVFYQTSRLLDSGFLFFAAMIFALYLYGIHKLEQNKKEDYILLLLVFLGGFSFLLFILYGFIRLP